jgi:hypothetical protein
LDTEKSTTISIHIHFQKVEAELDDELWNVEWSFLLYTSIIFYSLVQQQQLLIQPSNLNLLLLNLVLKLGVINHGAQDLLILHLKLLLQCLYLQLLRVHRFHECRVIPDYLVDLLLMVSEEMLTLHFEHDRSIAGGDAALNRSARTFFVMDVVLANSGLVAAAFSWAHFRLVVDYTKD